MKKRVADILKNYEHCEVIDDYSGRGMFGKQTYAIVYDSKEEFYMALSEAIEDENDSEVIEDENDSKDFYELTGFLAEHSIDSIGKRIIVY